MFWFICSFSSSSLEVVDATAVRFHSSSYSKCDTWTVFAWCSKKEATQKMEKYWKIVNEIDLDVEFFRLENDGFQCACKRVILFRIVVPNFLYAPKHTYGYVLHTIIDQIEIFRHRIHPARIAVRDTQFAGWN